MILSIIVAAAKNGVIGKAGDMPWHLPAESAYFRKITLGHPVIMGRKTYESMGRALPDRPNIVITRQSKKFKADGVVVVGSLDEALALDEVKKTPEAFVIGGQQINELALPVADKLYLTHIDAIVDGDTFFNYNPKDWEVVWSEHHKANAQNKYAFELTVQKKRK